MYDWWLSIGGTGSFDETEHTVSDKHQTITFRRRENYEFTTPIGGHVDCWYLRTDEQAVKHVRPGVVGSEVEECTLAPSISEGSKKLLERSEKRGQRGGSVIDRLSAWGKQHARGDGVANDGAVGQKEEEMSGIPSGAQSGSLGIIRARTRGCFTVTRWHIE